MSPLSRPTISEYNDWTKLGKNLTAVALGFSSGNSL
jgi:hypothetical protein